MKRKFILLPITLTALTPAISLVGCGDNIEPTEIFLNKNSIDLMVDSTFKLKAVVKPDGASQEVEWSTSNPSICKVKDGEVEAIGEGTATITVKAKGYDVSAVCIATVTTEPPKDYIMIDQYESHSDYNVMSSTLLSEPDMLPNNIYYAKIDMAKWKGSETASDYTNFSFELETFEHVSHLTKNNLEINLDGVTLDNNKVTIFHPQTEPGNDELLFNASCSEDLLKAHIIYVKVQTSSAQTECTQYFFHFYGWKNV